MPAYNKKHGPPRFITQKKKLSAEIFLCLANSLSSFLKNQKFFFIEIIIK